MISFLKDFIHERMTSGFKNFLSPFQDTLLHKII